MSRHDRGGRDRENHDPRYEHALPLSIAAVSFPTPHCTGVVHSVHAVAVLVVFLNVPAGQGRHTMSRSRVHGSARYKPGPQARVQEPHEPPPVDVLKVFPVSHGVQTVSAKMVHGALFSVPGGQLEHGKHGASLPRSALNDVPAVHCAHVAFAVLEHGVLAVERRAEADCRGRS